MIENVLKCTSIKTVGQGEIIQISPFSYGGGDHEESTNISNDFWSNWRIIHITVWRLERRNDNSDHIHGN